MVDTEKYKAMINLSKPTGNCEYCAGLLYEGDRFCPSCNAPIKVNKKEKNIHMCPDDQTMVWNIGSNASAIGIWRT